MKSDLIKLSIVLPVFNGGDYLKAAIESILNQTFTNFELIILNDGSTDESIKVIKHFAEKDSRIVVVDRENRGLVATLNQGVQLARADLIARMDADDVSMPARLKIQYEFMLNNPDIVAAGTGYMLVDERSNKIRKFLPEVSNEVLQVQALRASTPICHPTAIFRKREFLSVGGYREEAMLAEDLDLWLRIGEQGNIGNVSDVLLNYRQHSNSLSESKQIKQIAVMNAVALEACSRRKILPPSELLKPLDHWRSTGTKESNYAQILRYGWWAWLDGNVNTARIYAWKAVRLNPGAIISWKLLYCSWLCSYRASQ